MYHIVYLTTNLINNKIYVGKHSTYNLNDGYLGSGKSLQHAFKKYGKQNFKRQIIYFCLSENDANTLEEQIVDIHFIKRKDTYNIITGGKGTLTSGMKLEEIYGYEKSQEIKSKMSHVGESNGMFGRTHTESTKLKISKIHSGKIPHNKGITTPEHHIRKGWHHSEETLQKLSNAKIGKIMSKEQLEKHRIRITELNKSRTGIPMSKEAVLKSVESKKRNLKIKHHITAVVIGYLLNENM